ncbi:hypothetical protein Tco_0033218 [Tanacetum coccineum]
MKKAFQDMLHGLGEVNPTHAYYNGSRSSKDNEDPSWSTSFMTRRTQKTSSALKVLSWIVLKSPGSKQDGSLSACTAHTPRSSRHLFHIVCDVGTQDGMPSCKVNVTYFGVDDVVDEDEYDHFGELPPFSFGIPPMDADNTGSTYLRSDHDEGLWIDKPHHK